MCKQLILLIITLSASNYCFSLSKVNEIERPESDLLTSATYIFGISTLMYYSGLHSAKTVSQLNIFSATLAGIETYEQKDPDGFLVVPLILLLANENNNLAKYDDDERGNIRAAQLNASVILLPGLVFLIHKAFKTKIKTDSLKFKSNNGSAELSYSFKF